MRTESEVTTVDLHVEDVNLNIGGTNRVGTLEAEVTVEVTVDRVESAGFGGQPITPVYDVQIIEILGSWFGSDCNSEIHLLDDQIFLDNLPYNFDELAMEALDSWL
jgi:hypothetical protein